MGRVTINGTQSQFSCKKSIPLALWDAKGNCAKGRSKEALQLNRDHDNIKAQIIKHYQHLADREAFVTAEMVRNSYQGSGSEYETLLSAFDKDIANQKKRVGKDRAASTLWATLALSKGMPIESVSRVLGHTNIVTTQIYARITSQKLNDDLTMLGDKLNKSFSNIKMA